LEYLIQFFGRFHPLVVHLPIGILLLAVGLELPARRKKYAFIAPVLPLLWAAGFISAVAACIAGFLLKLSGDYDEAALGIHQYMGIALAATSGLVFFLKKYRTYGRLQLPVAVLSGVLLIGTGHYGGNLTHGEDFLTQPLMAFLGKEPVKVERKPITDIEQAVVFHDLVEPVLEEKCYNCHNGSKQKGKLRLDSPEFIMKGGKHGEVIVAGNAVNSELYKRLLLPEEDDDRMPPKGKTQLTQEEIELIRWWIAQGKADFKATVAQVPQDEDIKPVLAQLGGDSNSGQGKKTKTTMDIPAEKVAKANPADVEVIRKIGGVVTHLTPEQTFLSVNFVNNPEFSDEHINALLKLGEQIVWLDLSDTKITDKGLQQVGKLKNLTRLSLDNTTISDKGLAHLQHSKSLLYLNLYNTNITDEGLKSLEGIKNLQALYLWQTQVTPQGVALVKQAIGDHIEVNYGSNTDL
jgi:uncharacterized membrane protein/mono/diheme cytochrome c family protein